MIQKQPHLSCHKQIVTLCQQKLDHNWTTWFKGNTSLVWCSRRLAWEMSSTSHRVWTASLQADILLSSILLVLIVWAMVAARWRAHTFLNGCKKLKITQWMVARKTVYCKSFSYCKPPEGLFYLKHICRFCFQIISNSWGWIDGHIKI